MVNRVENDRRATLKDVATTLPDSATTASLIDEVVTNNLFSAKTAILRGLEAGSGVTLSVEDADNNRFNTNQKKIVISASGGGGGGEANTSSSAGGTSLVLPKAGTDLPFKGLTAGANITLTANANDVNVAVSGLGTAAFNNTGDFATAAQGTLASTALQDITGENLNDLSDVNVGTPGVGEDGYALTWNNGAGEFQLTNVSGGSFGILAGALVGKTGNQSLAGSTNNILLSWDYEEYDTNTVHDNVTNNSRLTVPAGASYIKVKVSLQWQSGVTGNLRSLRFLKNGSAAFFGNIDLNRVDETGAHNSSIYAETAPISVSPGDYFEVEVDNTDSTALLLLAGNTTWYAMEIVQ